MPDSNTELPNHVEATVEAITDLHAEHYRNADRMQRLVSLTASLLARPRTLGLLTAAIVGWIVLNLGLLASGRHVIDEPPFPYLAGAASIVAIYFTTVVLITQRHDDDLATRRDQLTLELAMLAEQKSTKIIGLLEELGRHKNPQAQPPDISVKPPAEPVRPRAMLDALQAAHQALDEQPE